MLQENECFRLSEKDIKTLISLKLNGTEIPLYLHLIATAQRANNSLIEVNSSELAHILSRSRQHISRAKKKLIDIGAIELAGEVKKIDNYGCLCTKKLYKVYSPELLEI